MKTINSLGDSSILIGNSYEPLKFVFRSDDLYFWNHRKDISKWLTVNTPHHFMYISLGTIVVNFLNIEDALLFELTWDNN